MADRDLRGPPDRRLLGFDDHVRSSLSDFKCDGASLCVVAGGKTVFAKGFGSTVSATDPQNQKPLDADSVFSVGGGGALLGLVAVAFANVLDWNANLKIDGIRDDATLADLMTHRIGLEADSLLATLLADLPAGAVASALKLSKNSKNFRGSSEYSPLTTPIAAHLLSQYAQRPFETLLHDLVFAKIGASHASCFVSQGREDSIAGFQSTPRDLARLVAAFLGGWAPVQDLALENMVRPVGVIDDDSCIDASPECGGFRITNCGWQSAIYRGKPRLSFGGYTSTSAIEITLFPTEDFGIVACATKPCHLPRAMSNVAADFLLEVNPGPWVPRMETAPFPFISTEYEVVNDPTDHLKPTPPPRSPHYYVGTYTSPIAPNVAFKITQTNGYLVIRFLNGHSESLQPTSQLFHLDNGTFYISTKTFFPPHLSYAATANQNCGIKFETGPDGQEETLVFFTRLTDLTNGLKFHKSVSYVAPTTTAPVQPRTTAKNSSARPAAGAPPPALPPRRTPDHSRQTSNAPLSSTTSNSTSSAPPILPPRSRQSSNATPAAVSTAPPTIPTRKTSTGADANSPMCTNATLDKLLFRSDKPVPEEKKDDELDGSMDDVSKDMDAVDDLFKEMGME